MKWNTVSGIVAAICLAIFSTSVVRAQSYEAALLAIAKSLVSKLEEANQRSGTVLDFTDLQGVPNELGRFLAQELSDQLVGAGRKISFVDRANLQTLLRENKLSVEGLVDPESSRKLGNLIGIDTIIFGTTTPMGDKIRLSVRAVNVETGKIVASQAATLAAVDGLGELYTRGVANAPAAGPSSSSAPRARFRADSVKIAGAEVVASAGLRGNPGYAADLVLTFVLENLSGIGFNVAIASGATSVGSCVGNEYQSSGLSVVDNRLRDNFRGNALSYFPTGAKINISVRMRGCNEGNFSGVKTTNVSLSLIIETGEDTFSIPMSASGVPVRVVSLNRN